MTEKNLVSRLRRGEKASFDELFNRYFEQCFTYAVSLLKDPDAAEDVVQNVFLKLWTGRERLDSSKPVKSYLLTAVRNESISWLRAKFVADRERRLVQEPEDETQNILNTISALELDATISAAISKLPEKRRQVFEKRRFEGKMVEQIADEMNLAVAKKKDSTGVCFIGERNFKAFLSNYLPAKRGDIVDIVSSRVIGKHDGVLYYTVGQHRGLDIGGIQGYKNEPFFVVGKDVKKNILYVAQEENDYMYSYKCKLTRVNLIMEEIPSSNFKCKAKFRYRGEDKDVELEYISEDEAYLHYNRYKYIAKGQIAVLYLGERCLGGGVIDEIYREDGSRIEY